jgi:hypothetical protein
VSVYQVEELALGNRWGILVVLFTVRLTMAFQFQSVAANSMPALPISDS